MSVRSGALRGTAETLAADRAPGPLSCRLPKMEFLLGNPFSTPVGQCLGKAARRTGPGGRRRRLTRPWGPRASAGHWCHRTGGPGIRVVGPSHGLAGPAHDAAPFGQAAPGGPTWAQRCSAGPSPSGPGASPHLRSGARGGRLREMPCRALPPLAAAAVRTQFLHTWPSALVPAAVRLAPSRRRLPAPGSARLQGGGDGARVPEGGHRAGHGVPADSAERREALPLTESPGLS